MSEHDAAPGMAGPLDALAVGNVYPSMSAIKRAIATYFARHNLGFKLPVNNKQKLNVTCTEHTECPFTLWAFVMRGSEQVRITSLNDEHGTTYVDCSTDRQRAPCRARGVLLAAVAKESITLTGDTVKLAQIRKKAKRDHFIDVTTMQAYRAKKTVLDGTLKHGKASYKFLHSWLKNMEDANPGTNTRFERMNGHFSRACIVHGAFKDVFQSALPVLAVDACHLKTKDQGILYLASFLTGNFDILVIGMAVSNSSAGENKNDWMWFLEAVSSAAEDIQTMTSLVVVSDRDKGLIPAVEEVLPAAYHSYCSVHIKRNVVAKFHTGKIHDIAKAAVKSEVDKMLDDLRSASPDIAEYLEAIGSDHWVTAYFPAPRFGIVTSNAAETMNSVKKSDVAQIYRSLCDSLEELRPV